MAWSLCALHGCDRLDEPAQFRFFLGQLRPALRQVGHEGRELARQRLLHEPAHESAQDLRLWNAGRYR